MRSRTLVTALAFMLMAAACTPGGRQRALRRVTDTARTPEPMSTAPTAPPRSPPLLRGHRFGPCGWRSTGRRTRTTRGSSSPTANGWYEDAGVDLQILPYATTTPGGAHRRGTDRLRDQLPGRADVRVGGRRPDRVGDGHPAAHRAGDRRPGVVRRSSVRATSTAGPTRGSATRTRSRRCESVIKADGGTGKFKTVTLETAAYEALYAKRADFVITFTAWEGHRGGASEASTFARSRSATTASRTSTRSSSPATADGWRRSPTWLGRSSAPRPAASAGRRRSPD